MGQIEIQGLGELGIAIEATYGTALVPTKFFPIRNESLTKVEDRQYRMNIRGLADRQAPMPSYTHIEGDVEIEATSKSLVYFLYAARCAITKSGTTPNFTYTFTPANVALPTTAATGPTARRTLTIYMQRAGETFGYSGCSIGRMAFSIDNSQLIATMSVFGIDEADLTDTAPTWPTEDPFGAGEVTLTSGVSGTPLARVDVDTINIEIQDNMTNEQRLKTGTGPAYNRWGEREVSGSFDTDFTDKGLDYDKFVAQTRMELTLLGSNGANDQVSIKVASAAWDSVPVNLGSLGDLVRASVDFHGFYSVTNDPYTIVVKTSEDIL